MRQVATLFGRLVALEPMSHDHVEALALVAAVDRSTFGFTFVPDGLDAMTRYVEGLMVDRANGSALPFVQRKIDGSGGLGDVIGCTRYMNFLHPLARSTENSTIPDEVEIGGTWLERSAQRTGVNTEAKLLLLTNAFENWQVRRVAICTDARNEQSRRAIERIGATFEGVLRSHRRSTVADESGLLRDTATYSVVADEWPDVKSHILALLR